MLLSLSAFLVTMLLGFQDCWRQKAALPMPAKAAFILAFGLLTLHKFLVLAVSLPHRPPPRAPRARRFHTSAPAVSEDLLSILKLLL